MKNRLLLWLQYSLRCNWNPALSQAATQAVKDGLELIVAISPIPTPLDRARLFQTEAIAEMIGDLTARGITASQIPMADHSGEARAIADLAQQIGARQVVADTSELREPRDVRRKLAALLLTKSIPLTLVDANYLVSPAQASDHQEWSAATLRRKLMPWAASWLDEARRSEAYWQLHFPRQANFTQIATPAQVQGGTSAARTILNNFISTQLSSYGQPPTKRELALTSTLSPWLHFGMISPAEILETILNHLELGAVVQESGSIDLQVIAHHSSAAAVFIEQIIVRRELSANWCRYNPEYDQYAGLPLWARTSLEKHRADKREYHYELEHWLEATTHDPFWNAAQQQLRQSGVIQGYMRMYWGKKILEWSASPEAGFDLAQELNDTLALDGRDPNGYAGIAWCFGAHDRPWAERPIFGMVRYMNAAGLQRKFNMQPYLDKWKPME